MPLQKVSKEELIKKVLPVFKQKGYHNATMSELAQACGVRNALFYYYFKDKEDLMAEVLQFFRTRSTLKLKTLVEDQDMSLSEKVQAFVQFLEGAYLGSFNGCIMANISLETAFDEPAFLPILKSFFDDWIASMSTLFLHKFQPEIAREMAEATVQDIEGGILLMKLYKDKHYLEKALNRFVKLLA